MKLYSWSNLKMSSRPRNIFPRPFSLAALLLRVMLTTLLVILVPQQLSRCSLPPAAGVTCNLPLWLLPRLLKSSRSRCEWLHAWTNNNLLENLRLVYSLSYLHYAERQNEMRATKRDVEETACGKGMVCYIEWEGMIEKIMKKDRHFFLLSSQLNQKIQPTGLLQFKRNQC